MNFAMAVAQQENGHNLSTVYTIILILGRSSDYDWAVQRILNLAHTGCQKTKQKQKCVPQKLVDRISPILMCMLLGQVLTHLKCHIDWWELERLIIFFLITHDAFDHWPRWRHLGLPPENAYQVTFTSNKQRTNGWTLIALLLKCCKLSASKTIGNCSYSFFQQNSTGWDDFAQLCGDWNLLVATRDFNFAHVAAFPFSTKGL